MVDSSPTTEPTPQIILRAAARVFAQAGYRAATVQAIAAEAGFTPPTVYAHFGSKQGLFAGLVEEVLGETFAALRRPHPEGLSLAQDLELRVRDVLELAERRRDAFMLFIRHPYDLPELTEHVDTDVVMRGHWERIFAGHVDELGDRTPLEAALLLEGAVFAWVRTWIRSGEGSIADQTRRIVDLVLNGLCPAAPTHSERGARPPRG